MWQKEVKSLHIILFITKRMAIESIQGQHLSQERMKSEYFSVSNGVCAAFFNRTSP